MEMSLNRLSFLCPQLWKGARVQTPSHPGRGPLSLKRKRSSRPNFSTTSQNQEQTFPQRYGTAKEPQQLSDPNTESSERTKTLAAAIENNVKDPAPPKQETKSSPPQTKGNGIADQESLDQTVLTATKSSADDAVAAAAVAEASESSSKITSLTVSREALVKPMDHLSQLQDISPAKNDDDNNPPHLQTPQYLHNFDTYTIVRDLKQGGFTHAQSVTLTKAVRNLLGANLDIAKQMLVSKSDMENETYLFRAACSELRTEILNARKASTNKMATQRAHLQHEVDILSQKASQEALNLKDDLRGMLNDRRMDARMDQQGRDSAIQELNYKITVALNSDSKSEIEGLRWVLTRRAAMAIAGMALLILGSLRYSSYKLHENQKKPQNTSTSSTITNNNPTDPSSRPSYTVPAREAGTQTDDALLATVEPSG